MAIERAMGIDRERFYHLSGIALLIGLLLCFGGCVIATIVLQSG